MRIVPAILLVLVVGAAAGCGGGKKSGQTTTAAATPAAQRAEIARVWERFFAGSTSAADKQALLENGSSFAAALTAAAKSPFAKQSGAKVTRVVLTGPTTASVRYTITLGGKPALAGQNGTAVKVAGAWKVGRASFCKLLSLQGSVPKACSAAG